MSEYHWAWVWVALPCTKEYISERAEQLRKYVRRLQREILGMENNPVIQDLQNEWVSLGLSLSGFTKEYISERAEQLRKYVRRLQREIWGMENNPVIQDLQNEWVLYRESQIYSL